MHITVSETPKRWTAFEKKEWKKVELDHYGQFVDWKKEEYLIAATEKKQIVGTLRMSITAGVACFEALIVSEELRGQGIGKKLVLKAEETAKAHGAHKIYLQTGIPWSASNFYQKHGFTITSKLPNHYFHVDFVEMTNFL